jgi:deoxyribonuclease II
MALSAQSDTGKPVDWWFMYKISGKSTVSGGSAAAKLPDGSPVRGDEYIYIDSTAPATAKLVLSADRVTGNGALPNTLRQVYGSAAAANKNLGWFFYSDQPPTGPTTGTRGHAKGMLAFDLASNSAVWLIESVPKFPPKGAYAYPKSGMPNAQTMLCITLANADVAANVAKQMFAVQEPNIYSASAVPTGLAGEPNDPRVKLIKNLVASGSTPVSLVVPFLSKGGVKFMSIAKNRTWGLDFYNDLVGPTLHDDLDVETWEHDPTPPAAQSDKIHTVVDMRGVDLTSLGLNIAWPETDDHAKLAIADDHGKPVISARSEATHFVCVGDINFTIAQRKRGGATVAFKCEPLWSSISGILRDVYVHATVRPGTKNSKTNPPKKTKTTAKRKSAKKKT